MTPRLDPAVLAYREAKKARTRRDRPLIREAKRRFDAETARWSEQRRPGRMVKRTTSENAHG